MTLASHQPVLLQEILDLADTPARVVDGTLGDGGHAAAFVARGAKVLGIDRDPGALARARARIPGPGLTLVEGCFDDDAVLLRVRAFAPDFLLLDLGVSSRQLDDDALGFTFRPGAPLDMRMSRSGTDAAALLNRTTEADLADLFHRLADEPRARRLAREIVRRRATAPFRTSDDLVNAIRSTLGPRSGPGDFARLFQAVRIAVNSELERLERALPLLRDALAPGGRLAVISYHSGEDRIVKQAFREWAAACVCPPDAPVCGCRGEPLGKVLTRRPVRPSAAESEGNPRARSARLRMFEGIA